MLVPFIYATNDFTLEVPAHIWIFHKYANFACQNNYPIIASAIYFKPYENPLSDYIRNNFIVEETPSEYLSKMEKYAIKNDGVAKKINKDNTLEITSKSFIKIDKILEKELTKILNNIKKDYPKEKITILTWLDNATLRKVAKKMHIKIIYQELSCIRSDQYNSTLCYFSFNSKYNDSQKKNYEEFLKIKEEVPVLSKEEILALFLRDDELKCLKDMRKSPKYKVGFSPGIKVDWFFKLYSKEVQSKTLEKIKKMFPTSEISYRFHPSHELELDFSNCHRDSSRYSHNWILLNDAIISSVSNVGFEAMLFGKKAFVLTDNMPWSFIACNKVEDLKYMQEGIIPDSFISYMVFGYFVPLELAFNKEYLEWRLTNPSIKDIYNKNLKFILKKKNIELNNREELTLYNILTKYRKLSSEEAHGIVNYNYYNEEKAIFNEQKEHIEALESNIMSLNNNLNNLKNNIVELKKDLNAKKASLEHSEEIIENLKLELDKIINSKSWKITRPLRSLSKTIKRINSGEK